MFKSAEFIRSVYHLKDLPSPKYPEIAILGRSNAGKSSLINALLNQKRLARVSSTPGFTRALNFYLVDRKLYLVDLPGYGFAKISKELKRAWKPLIEGYLQSVRDLRLLLLIFDLRRKPDELDLALLEFLSTLAKSYQVVLNKIDLLKPEEIGRQVEEYKRVLSLRDEDICLVSCQQKRGLSSIKKKIEAALLP